LPLLPIAAFLAGALLSLLLPVAILTGLSMWYWWHSLHVAEADRSEIGKAPAGENPGPSVQEELPPDPGA
jgi:hypothetical protein